MPLVLGLYEGGKFYVGSTPVELEKIREDGTLQLVVHHQNGPKSSFVVNDMEAQEIVPEVFVSMGKSKKQQKYGRMYRSSMARVAIEAPRNIVILREELYDSGRKRT